jgi:hypothetical protein
MGGKAAARSPADGSVDALAQQVRLAEVPRVFLCA